MKIVADTHTHTIASGHAFSTLTENCIAAKKLGLFFLATTDHTSRMPGAPDDLYFECQYMYPDEYDDVYLIRGCEVNIVNVDGELDMNKIILSELEWVIASMHDLIFIPSTKECHTQSWLNIAENPHVDVIGHCSDPAFAFEHLPVIRAFAEHGKIVEINSNSIVSRPGSAEILCEIVLLCKKFDVPVVVGSDAHHHSMIGNFAPAMKLLGEIDFPEELVLNADCVRFAKTITKKCVRQFNV
jgi:putative hydrolase